MPKVSELTATPALGDGDLIYVVADGASSKLASLRVSSIAAMTAIAVPLNGMSVEVTEDGRGGLFVFDTSATAAADGGTTFKADDATTGSWVRRYDGAVNVKWFGAAGDGVTDDTAEIQAAIDALDTAHITETGGVLYFPRGTYMISSTIYIRNTHTDRLASVTIRGAGMQNTTIACLAGFTGNEAVYMEDSFYCRMEELHILGSYRANTGLRIAVGAEITLFRVFTQQFNTSGFLLDRCFMVSMIQCRAKSAQYPFDFSGEFNTSLFVANCYAVDPHVNTNSAGFNVVGVTYSTFLSCGSDNTKEGLYGYRIANVQGVSFIGCGAEGQKRAAFNFVASAALDALYDINGCRCSVIDCFGFNSDTDLAGFGSIYSNQVDTSAIDVHIERFQEYSVAGSVSVENGGVLTDHRLRLNDCKFVNNVTSATAVVIRDDVIRTGAVSITAADTPVIDLANVFGTQNHYSGLLHIWAGNGEASGGAATNVAGYVLLVTKSAASSSVELVSSNGMTAGGDTNHPSFTWTIDTANNHLEATPVASTTGTFYFYVSQLGGLFTSP